MDYNEEHATEYIYSRLPEDLMARFEPEQILIILHKEFEYEELCEDLIGLSAEIEPICNYPIEIDEEQMKYYIIHECAKIDLFISYEELDQILDLDLEYMEEIGLTEDIGVVCN